MPLYGYEAVDNKGRTLKGAIEADNEQLVLAKLHEQGLHVVRVAPQRTKTQLFSGVGKSKKPKLQALVLFTRQFATMIDAGIPILRCLDILHTQTKDHALKNAIDAIRKDVKAGMALNEAMEKHPLVFSDLFVNMIRAAEVAGILDQILDRLGDLPRERPRSAPENQVGDDVPRDGAGLLVPGADCHLHLRAAEVQGNLRQHECGDAHDDEVLVQRK
jgi:type II secretory pathway component PulF